MNYNDHMENHLQQQLVLNGSQDQHQTGHSFQNQIQSTQFNKNRTQRNKQLSRNEKQNYSQNININMMNMNNNNNKGNNIETNHSFNGFFNQNHNNKQFNNMINSNSNINMRKFGNQIKNRNDSSNLQLKDSKSGGVKDSVSRFNSSGKFSNFQFITESSKSGHQSLYIMHPQTEKFIMKYFPQNYQNNQFYQQYISLSDFVQILFQQYQNIIGKNKNSNLFDRFMNKIYEIFGQTVYFQHLFKKTYNQGLIGLVFEAFKSIEEDNLMNRNGTNCSNVKASYQNNIQLPLTINNTNQSVIKKNHAYTAPIQNNHINNNKTNFIRPNKPIMTKISLEKFFNNNNQTNQTNNSKLNILDYSSISNNPKINQQELQQIKCYLSQYIQQMYSQAQQKLNRRSNQEYKKIMLKYKQTQKILQKINQKIALHYDTLKIQKQFNKKIQTLKNKQKQLENTINKLNNQIKINKTQIEKQKCQNVKLQQDIDKLNKKIEKYQNAIFQKAMERNTNNANNNNSSLGNSQISQNNHNNYSNLQKSNLTYNNNGEISSNKPRIQFKVDTYSQHRPTIIAPMVSNIRSTSPFVPRQLNYPTTPKRQYERSVSPLNKRVSFNQPQSIPTLNNSNLQVSAVRRVQIGDPITIKPISPVLKLQTFPSQMNLEKSANIKLSNINLNYNQTNSQVSQGQKFYSSRITTISPLRR